MPGKKLSDDWIHQSPEVTAAYSVCLDAEKCLVPQQPPIFALAKVEALERARALVKIRILGYLLVFGPTDTARKHVAGTILTEKEKGPEALIELGGYYEKYFLHPFYKGRGCATPHYPRRFSDATLAAAACAINPQPTTHLEATKSALVRDEHRCMVSGNIDNCSWLEFEELRQPRMSVNVTQCVHIFAPFTSVWIEDGQRVYLERDWAIIRAFGYQDICNELVGPGSNTHRLENIMTLTFATHDCFDRLELWFEPTDTPNSYKVCTNIPALHSAVGIPENVVFTTTRQDLHLPSPRYLKIHATCCRVAHTSGAAAYYRDAGDYRSRDRGPKS